MVAGRARRVVERRRDCIVGSLRDAQELLALKIGEEVSIVLQGLSIVLSERRDSHQ